MTWVGIMFTRSDKYPSSITPIFTHIY